MAGEFPTDLRAEVQTEVARILKLVQEAGWRVDPIYWESGWDGASERRVTFTAKSEAGKRVHSTCPESALPWRLSSLLGSQ
jgi:hypothetical protein